MRRVFIITMAAMLAMFQVNGNAQHRNSTQGRNATTQARDNRQGAAVTAGRRGAGEVKPQPQVEHPRGDKNHNNNGQAMKPQNPGGNRPQDNHMQSPKPNGHNEFHNVQPPKNRPNDRGYTTHNGIRSGRRAERGTRYHYGYAVPKIHNYQIINSGGTRYYYSGNTYYTLRGHEYIISRPPYGVTVNLDDHDLWVIRVGSRDYWFDDYGVFYRMKGNGLFKVVEPPIGAVIPFLPADYTIVRMSGETLYQVENIIYRPVYYREELSYEVVRRINW